MKHEIHNGFYFLLEVQKGFQNMEVKTICAKFVLMELINLLVFSGDVIRDTNMQNPHLFTFGNKKLQYMSATTQMAAKEN